MRSPWQIFAKYPASIICYLIYITLAILGYISDQQYKMAIERNHGVRIGGVREFSAPMLIYPLAVIFLIVSSANAIAAKENKFYLWLILFILIPLIVITN